MANSILKPSFKLPEYQTILNASITLNRLNTHVMNHVAHNLQQFEANTFGENPDGDDFVKNVVKYFINQICTNSNSQNNYAFCFSFNVINFDRNDLLLRLSCEFQTMYDMCYWFIRINMLNYGIFTELYEQIPYEIFIACGCRRDRFIPVITPTHLIMNDRETATAMERSFEEHRQQEIEKKYSDNHNHPITESDRVVLKSDDNSECGLCCGDSTCVCCRCHYAVCDQCREHIGKATGQCPSCGYYPFRTCKIVTEENGWNEQEVADLDDYLDPEPESVDPPCDDQACEQSTDDHTDEHSGDHTVDQACEQSTDDHTVDQACEQSTGDHTVEHSGEHTHVDDDEHRTNYVDPAMLDDIFRDGLVSTLLYTTMQAMLNPRRNVIDVVIQRGGDRPVHVLIDPTDDIGGLLGTVFVPSD